MQNDANPDNLWMTKPMFISVIRVGLDRTHQTDMVILAGVRDLQLSEFIK